MKKAPPPPCTKHCARPAQSLDGGTWKNYQGGNEDISPVNKWIQRPVRGVLRNAGQTEGPSTPSLGAETTFQAAGNM